MELNQKSESRSRNPEMNLPAASCWVSKNLSFPLVGNPSERFWTSQNDRYKDTPQSRRLSGWGIENLMKLILKKISFMFFVFCILSSVGFAENTDTELDSQREEYKKLQKDIDEHHEKVEKTKQQEDSILEEIDRTNRELINLHSELKKYREKRKATEKEIRRVEANIASNKSKLNRQKEWLKRKLRSMQKHGYSGDIIILLSTSEDISQLMRRWQYIKAMALYDHKMMQAYKETLKHLAKQEKRLKTLHSELRDNEEDIEVNIAAISDKKKEKEMLLASVRKEKSSYEEMLQELKETSRKLLEIIKRSEEAAKFAPKGFQTLKGRLPWPVNGRVVIPYGTQKDPQFKTPVFRNGIHIKAEDDSTAKAVYSGKVVYADWFKGYGQLIIVSHGEGYHTLYANLSEIFYKVGDIIKGQAAIGRVGESGTLNAPGLYFEIRYKGKPLDPAQWLKRR